MKKILIIALVAVIAAVGVVLVVLGTRPAGPVPEGRICIDEAEATEEPEVADPFATPETVDIADVIDNPDTDVDVSLVSAEGFVTEIGDDYFVLSGIDGSIMLQANQTAETTMNTGAPLAIGDYVTVYHNGNITRSIPPQAAAIAVNGAYVSGTVSELEQDRFLLTQEDGTQIVVNLPDSLIHYACNDMVVTVYYNGMMTFSLPAQITADYVRGLTLEGIITDVTPGQITLDLGEDIAVFNYSENTLLFVNMEIGMKVQIVTTGTATMSLPAQYTALEILPAKTK